VLSTNKIVFKISTHPAAIPLFTEIFSHQDSCQWKAQKALFVPWDASKIVWGPGSVRTHYGQLNGAVPC